jgi:hypothetical protein
LKEAFGYFWPTKVPSHPGDRGRKGYGVGFIFNFFEIKILLFPDFNEQQELDILNRKFHKLILQKHRTQTYE